MKDTESKQPKLSNMSHFIDDGFIVNYVPNLAIIKPFYSAAYATNFKVCNPKKNGKGDYIEYTVYGVTSTHHLF